MQSKWFEFEYFHVRLEPRTKLNSYVYTTANRKMCFLQMHNPKRLYDNDIIIK